MKITIFKTNLRAISFKHMFKFYCNFTNPKKMQINLEAFFKLKNVPLIKKQITFIITLNITIFAVNKLTSFQTEV